MRQFRLRILGLIRRVKLSGIPTGLATSRQAPVSDMLRITQSIPAVPKVIDAPFSVRSLGLFRSIFMGKGHYPSPITQG
jgi:hypothetical protein